jgi:hypothetical protein
LWCSTTKLLEVLDDDVSQEEAFAQANDVLKNAVGGIAEIINVPGEINVDFEDVRTVMGEPGKAMMGTAIANGPDRARIAAEQAVACPLLEGIDLSGAKGVLVLIIAAKGSLKLKESRLAMDTIRAYASADAHVIYGTAYDESLGDNIRITVVATGLTRQAMRRTAPPLAGAAHRHRQRAFPRSNPEHRGVRLRVSPTAPPWALVKPTMAAWAHPPSGVAVRLQQPRSMRCPAAAWTTTKSRRSCASKQIDLGHTPRLRALRVASLQCLSQRQRLFGAVQACAGRLGAAPLSPLQGATPVARHSRFHGVPGRGKAFWCAWLLIAR